MATSSVKYFSGTTEVRAVSCMDNKKFFAQFGFVSRFVRYDGYSMWIAKENNEILPVTRIIYRKSNPSMHKCDARCQHAKGHNCECSCGGQFHGAAA